MSLARTFARLLRSMTAMQWVAVILFTVAGAGAVIGAIEQWWVLVVLSATVGVAVILAVQIYGFRQLTRRVNRRLDRVATAGSHSTPTPMTGSDDHPAEVMVDEVLARWARELRSRPSRLTWFTKLARETRARGARDVLAFSATRGAANFGHLSKAVEQVRMQPSQVGRLARLGRILWKPGFFALARVLYSQRISERDLRTCLTMYELADRIYGVEGFLEGMDRSLYSDLLTWSGQFSRADDVLAFDEQNPERALSQKFLQLNAVNPNVSMNTDKRSEWISRMNRIFASSGLAEFEFPEDEAPSFYNIRVRAEPVAEAGLPMISVIMPIYEPNEATDVALRSLVTQTWTNLEILVIDDCSPDTFEDGSPTPYRSQLQAWADADSRVKLILCEENRGAYAVRNDAFDVASGEFVTVADKDDWHHPQKLERQARQLMRQPDRGANIVNWVRADENLKFLVRWGPDRVIHPSFASIMYRREEVRNRLGYWDAVRKSADGEHRKRYELVYSERLVAEDGVPMAISLLGDGNLTSSDFGLGYRHPDREIYQDAYSAWHEEVAAGDSPFMPKPVKERKWIGPPSFLPDRDRDSVPHYDVVYLSEFGLLGGNSLSLEQEIQTALDAGLRVGVIPLQNGLVKGASTRRMTPMLRRMFLDGQVDRLHLHRQVTATLMVIHWPPIMQLLPDGPSHIQVERMVVVANQVPAMTSKIYYGYEAEDVSTNCFETFGHRPLWAPQSSVVRRRLLAVAPFAEIADVDWPGVAEPAPGTLGRSLQLDGAPVLGHPWDEEELNWPVQARDRDAVFPKDGSVNVILRGHVQALVRRGVLKSRTTLPHGWQVIEGEAETRFREYLDELDFLVCFGGDVWDESTEPSILEALAKGVVCVGPQALSEVYGDAVVCCEPRQVQATLRHLWDADAYEAQRRRGFEFLERARTREDYLRRLEKVGVERSVA